MVLRKITKRLQWESEIKLERLKRKVANLSCSLKKSMLTTPKTF